MACAPARPSLECPASRTDPRWSPAYPDGPLTRLGKSDQRVVPEQVAVGAPLADADEDMLRQPVVLALGAFEGGLAAQVILVVRDGIAPAEDPFPQPLNRVGLASPQEASVLQHDCRAILDRKSTRLNSSHLVT